MTPRWLALVLASLILTTACDRGPGGKGGGTPPDSGPSDDRGGGNGGNTDWPDDPGGPGDQPVPGLDVAVADVQTEEGCLDLSKLYGHLRSLPATARIRLAATQFKLSPFPGGPRPRDIFVNWAANTNFQQYHEADAPGFVQTLPQVVQSGCAGGTFQSGEGGDADFEITSSAPDQLTYKYAGKEETLILSDRREITIFRKTSLGDHCREGDRYQADVRQVIRWDVPETLLNRPERMAKAFVRRILRSLEAPPAGFDQMLQDTTNGDHVDLAPVHLDTLLQSPVSLKHLRCRAPNPGPSPTPTPTPTPTPAPAGEDRPR